MEPITSKLHFKSYLYVIALHKSKPFKKNIFFKKKIKIIAMIGFNLKVVFTFSSEKKG